EASKKLADASINAQKLNKLVFGLRTFAPGIGIATLGAVVGVYSGNWALAGGIAGLGAGVALFSGVSKKWNLRSSEIEKAIQNIKTEQSRQLLNYQNRLAEANTQVVHGIRGIAEATVQIFAAKYPKPQGMSMDEYKGIIRQQINSANTGQLEDAVKAVDFALSTSSDD
ncbi:MAG TPA: hypothetical protein PLS50_07810, partial [Candidatus Dojkabacteria bacterium]|nr:hypothetical protein [Candidatus Dojkabacteria bacterium]